MDRHLVEKKSVLTEESREGTRSGDMPRRSQDVSAPSREILDQSSSKTLKEYLDQISKHSKHLNTDELNYVRLIHKYIDPSHEENISNLQPSFEQGFLRFLEKSKPEDTNRLLVGVLEDIIKRYELRKTESNEIEELEQRLQLKESAHLENQLKKDETKACDAIIRMSDMPTAYHYNPLQITDKQISLIQKYIKRGDMQPKHILDTDVSIGRYNEMSYAFSGEQSLKTQINYAIKSQSNTYLLRDLMRNGLSREKEDGQSRFGMDAASKGEIKKCIHAARAIGIDAREICSRITLSNPNIQQKDIDYALKNGVRSFVVHNFAKLTLLCKIAEAHGVKKEVEIITRIPGPPDANKTGGDKFGADLEACEKMLLYAHNHGMKPTGMAVHVGWQVDSAEQMKKGMNYALGKMAQTFKNMENHGIKLSIVDLGGGWPNQFRGKPVPSISENSAIVRELMDEHFGYLDSKKPTLILEPGNYLSAAAGVTKAHIINIDQVPNKPGRLRCVLDVGMFNGGLVDGHYPVSTIIDNKAVEVFMDVPPDQESQDRVVIFGPSCDSSDKVIGDVILSDNPEIHKRFRRMIEANNAYDDIKQVNRDADQPFIILHGTGAYTSEYNVGKVGKEGFNSIRNPELVVLSKGRVIKADASPLRRLLGGLTPRLSHRFLRSEVSRLWRTAVNPHCLRKSW
jgi:diaminopimelate decarboxylase